MVSEIMSTRKKWKWDIAPVSIQNLQELASNINSKEDVPDHYIRPEIEFDELSIDESQQVPVIDMIKLASDHSDYEDEMAKLHHACKEWGFFQVINHGAAEAIQKMRVVAEDFFKLPLDQKMAYEVQPNHFEGYGQEFVYSEGQKMDWGVMLTIAHLPVSQRDMRFWPSTPTSFRSTFEEYSSEVNRVFVSLIKLMATNLGVDSDKFGYTTEDSTQAIRMNYYPPSVLADKVLGISPHSDASALTLLVQDNDVQALQIKHNNKWAPIIGLPDAIIVNIGDTMEIMTNGEYRSIEHRALVNFEKSRLSFAAFHGPSYQTKVGPLPDFVTASNEAKFKTVEYDDYVRMIVTRKLDGKSLINQMKINPEKHY